MGDVPGSAEAPVSLINLLLLVVSHTARQLLWIRTVNLLNQHWSNLSHPPPISICPQPVYESKIGRKLLQKDKKRSRKNANATAPGF